MNKITTFLLASTCSLTLVSNSFSMLTQTPTKHTKDHLSSTDNKLLRAYLVHNRHQIKENNNILIEHLTEQNKVIAQLEKFSGTYTPTEYECIEDKITACAQQLLELELEIRKPSQPFESKL